MGMISSQMPTSVAPPSAPQAAMPAPKSKVNPQDIQKIVIASMNALYAQGAVMHAVEMIKSASDPASGLADVTYHLMQSIYSKAGSSLNPSAMVPAAQEVVKMVAESTGKAGLKLQPKDIQRALAIMLQQLLQSAGMKTPGLSKAIAGGDSPVAPAAPQGGM